MQIHVSVQMNLQTGAVGEKVRKAASQTLKDTTIDIAHDVVEGSPVLTGNNRRSIQYDIKELEASVFSTSGYGGFLETGTKRMSARPYFKPALDKNFTQEKLTQMIKDNLGA